MTSHFSHSADQRDSGHKLWPFACLSASVILHIAVLLFLFACPVRAGQHPEELLEFIDRLDGGSDVQAAEQATKALEQWIQDTKPYEVQTKWEVSEYEPYYERREPLLRVAANTIRIFCQQPDEEYTERAHSIYTKVSDWLGDGPMERGIRVELAKGFFWSQRSPKWIAENIWRTLAFPEELFLPDSVLGEFEPAYYYDEESGASFYEQQNSHFLYLRIARVLVEALLRDGEVEMAQTVVGAMQYWHGTHAKQIRDLLTKRVEDARNQ